MLLNAQEKDMDLAGDVLIEGYGIELGCAFYTRQKAMKVVIAGIV